MYFWCFCFRGEHGFLGYDAICMCVVNKYFELLKFIFNFVYVDLKYNETYLTFTADSVCLCGVCGHPWSVCEVVSVPYVGGVVVVCPFQPSSSLIQVLRV